MKYIKDRNKFLNENELSAHGNIVGDMKIIYDQIVDFIKPGDKKSGYDATIKKHEKQIDITNDDNYVIVKDNGLPNDFYIVYTKDSGGKSDEGNENSAENVLTFIGSVFNKSNGLDFQDETTKNGKINNKYENL